MAIKDEIKEIYLSEQFAFITLQDLYKLLPAFNRSSIRSALSRGTKTGDFERTEDGVYFFDYEKYEDDLREEAEEEAKEEEEIKAGADVLYGYFRHAKRITDTHTNKKRVFDIDIEMTCQGYAPIDWSIEAIEDIVNPKLVERSIELLTFDQIYLEAVGLDITVIGSEWRRQDKKDTFVLNREWNVEVKIVTARGYHNVIEGEFYVHEW